MAVPARALPADLDSALGELGMLSTVTESRKQYLKELERSQGLRVLPRERNLSESAVSCITTPPNSPSQGSYHILQLNTHYVTSLSTGAQNRSPAALQDIPVESMSSSPHVVACEPRNDVRKELSFGEQYENDDLEKDVRASRISRLKMARIRRFHKPYRLPRRHTLTLPPTVVVTPTSQPQYCLPTSAFSNLSLSSSPDTMDVNRQPGLSSNISTPEKAQSTANMQDSSTTVVRSRSLDDLDLSKLQLAETENHNILKQRKEIDHVAQTFQDLNVKE